MKIPRNAALLVCFCLASLACGASSPQQPAPKGWVLTWADEFNGANGSALDAAKWVQGRQAKTHEQRCTARNLHIGI